MDNDLSQKAIAETLGVARSTISRELSRNVAKRGPTAKTYEPANAHRRADRRHRDKAKRHRFTQGLKNQVKQWLETEKLSPELISAAGGGRASGASAMNGYTSGYGGPKRPEHPVSVILPGIWEPKPTLGGPAPPRIKEPWRTVSAL